MIPRALRAAGLWLIWALARFWGAAHYAINPQSFLLVQPKGVPYLARWRLTPTGDWWARHLPRIFLHCFLDSDGDRGWHSHPWEWASFLILDGTYFESRAHYDTFRSRWGDCWFVRTPGMVNRLTRHDFHKVKLATKRVWTLAFVGPLHGREWEFMNEAGERFPHGTNTPGD